MQFPGDPKMAMRDFDWAQTLGLNFWMTGATHATVYVGTVRALTELPVGLSQARVQVNGQVFSANTSTTPLRSVPPDYIECADMTNVSSCRAFDANNFALADTAHAYTAGSPAAPGLITVTATLDAPAEIALFEREAAVLGPF